MALEALLHSNGFDTNDLRRLENKENLPLYSLPVPGDEAIALWERLRQLVEPVGYRPVLLGDDQDLESQQETLLSRYFPPLNIMREQATQLDVPEWLQMTLDMRYDYDEEEEGFSLEDMVGEWPTDIQPGSEFAIPLELSTNLPKPTIHFALVPTVKSWEIPMLLRFGDWNYCPAPEEHAAVLRYWEAEYGVEVVAITHDQIEMKVRRPPQSRSQALKLAYEQYAYCPDIVEQGVETLSALAALLLGGTVWYFWWD